MSLIAVKQQLHNWVNRLEKDINDDLKIIRAYIEMIKIEKEPPR